MENSTRGYGFLTFGEMNFFSDDVLEKFVKNLRIFFSRPINYIIKVINDGNFVTEFLFPDTLDMG